MFGPLIARKTAKALAKSSDLQLGHSNALTWQAPGRNFGRSEAGIQRRSVSGEAGRPSHQTRIPLPEADRSSWCFSKVLVFPPDQRSSFPHLYLQPKLAIGAINDPLEHEADRVAEQVMRMQEPSLSLAAAHSRLSRRCAACENEEDAPALRTKPTKSAELAAIEATLTFDEVLRSPGQPLDPATRAFFEPRFGYDFGCVRVHTDAKAAESARAVNALAYTVGRDVMFGAGQYAAKTHAGQRLLAHELAHVIQQNHAIGMLSAPGIGLADDKHRREAPVSETIIRPTAQPTARLMRTPDKRRSGEPCLDACEDEFDRCLDRTRFPPECIARRGSCLNGCEAKAGGKPTAKEEPSKIRPEDIVIKSRGREEHVDPSKITAGIWWFNGAVPFLAPLYPSQTAIDTGLADGEFKYQVTAGSDKLALLDGTKPVTVLTVKDMPAVTVRGIGASTKAKDVELTITHTPTGAKRAAVYRAQLEVRAPHHLELMGCTHAPNGSYGYQTSFAMKALDNFGKPIPFMDVNEDFDSGILERGVSAEWDAAVKARKKGSTLTLSDGTFEDKYAASVSGGKPPDTMTPKPSNPQSPLGSTLAGTFHHRWYVGTRKTGEGVNVSVHLGKFYADHGEYNDFTSPVTPPGKPVTCPAPAKPNP